jgi:hypothetical protein
MEGSRIQPDQGTTASLPLRQGVLFETPSELGMPVKTPEGQAEIRQRQRGLSQRQRTMLLLVDGRRSVAQLKQVAVQAGATDTCFDELLDLGLIAVVEPTQPNPVSAKASAAAKAPAPAASAATLALPPLTLQLTDGLAPAPAALTSSAPLQAAPPLALQLTELPIDSAAPVAATAAVPTPFPPLIPPEDPSNFAPLSDERMELLAEMDTPAPKSRAAKGGPGIVDSVMGSLFPLLESAFGAMGGADEQEPRDDALEEARRILVREIKAKAPVTGSITLMKLRRARTRDDLSALFEEVDAHISKPMRHLSAQQTLLHVRGLLSGAPTESWTSRV